MNVSRNKPSDDVEEGKESGLTSYQSGTKSPMAFVSQKTKSRMAKVLGGVRESREVTKKQKTIKDA